LFKSNLTQGEEHMRDTHYTDQ